MWNSFHISSHKLLKDMTRSTKYLHKGNLGVLFGQLCHHVVHLRTLRSPWRPKMDHNEGPVNE